MIVDIICMITNIVIVSGICWLKTVPAACVTDWKNIFISSFFLPIKV